jgi:signal transduction histidine kinase
MTLTVLTAVIAAAIGVVIAAKRMFISDHDAAVLISIAVTAAVVGTGCALAVGLRVMRQLQDQADAVSRQEADLAIEASRRQLVAWMSHDIRSPLAGIRAMAEAIEDGVVEHPATVSQYNRAISQETVRLNEMLDDLLTLSRMQDRELSLNKERVTLSDIVAQAMPSAAPLARSRQVQLVGDGPELAVDVDARQVTRVVSNLLSNAIRHTREGSTVLVDGGHDGDQVYLAIEDECGGIAEHDLPHVFDVAFRGSAARTPSLDGGGAGLGLAIAHGILAAHGGCIDVRNVGGGCRFTVRFPQPVVARVPAST